MQEPIVEPQLEAPGAGISKAEMFVLNRVIKPFRFPDADLPGAKKTFQDSSQILESLGAFIPENQLTTRILVDRPYYVEDSSRFWSAAMLFRHLTKVNFALTRAIEGGVSLTADRLPRASERVAAVKPEVDRNSAIAFAEFQNSVKILSAAIESRTEAELRGKRIPHPWMGDISHLQWIWFSAFHNRVHLRQLRKILSQLG